jgi:protein-tyrosine phosphatase
MKSISVLFVCLGNICRSPTAHAVFRHLVNEKQLDIEIDSAGTIGYHQGAKPDARSMEHGIRRGYNFDGLFSRKVLKEDFEKFDYILAMDKSNLADLHSMAPQGYLEKVQLFLDFANRYPQFSEVPDPYYGGEKGFELVLDLIEDASSGLLKHLEERREE